MASSLRASETPRPSPVGPGRSSGDPSGADRGDNRYQTLFVVGRGGMGTVEVAIERSADGFERIVALKRLLPEGARDPRHKEMFLREARLAALLTHRNVVHAFAFGELYGELFLAMEYVEGQPLSSVLSVAHAAGESLDPALVAHVLAEICDGLHAAHELRDAGGHPLHVVHRDVSPHNVMIAYDGHVKVLDFGVAKFDAVGAAHETRTGEVKGKMAYMSPEQALGEKLDHRSDLFSVGAVLFECLTGRRMWGAGTDLDVMRRLALEDPPRLDNAVAAAPPALVALHARLVAREPAHRPASAREVANQLRAFAESPLGGSGASAVQTLMTRLFNDEAERRRAELTEALERAAPARVEALRRSLEPGAAFERPTLTEPLIVRRSATPGPVRVEKAGARAILLLLACVVLASGIAAAAAVVRRSSEPEARPPRASPTEALTASSIATADVPAPSPPPVTTAATATPTARATPTPTPTVRPAAIPAPTPALTSTPRRLRVSKPAPTTRLPDVDPTPF